MALAVVPLDLRQLLRHVLAESIRDLDVASSNNDLHVPPLHWVVDSDGPLPQPE